jgi:hypothetical protein
MSVTVNPGSVARRPNLTKPVQARPNKSKQKRLDLFGFIRPNRDFSMGYDDSKQKILLLLVLAVRRTEGAPSFPMTKSR